MKKDLKDILIIGKLAGNDLIIAENLCSRGLSVTVARKNTDHTIDTFTDFHRDVNLQMVEYHTPIQFISLAKSHRLILSFTGELIFAMRFLWVFRYFISLPPVINATTGSDITELVAGTTLVSKMYRQYLRYSKVNWCSVYPHALKNIIKYKIPNIVFMMNSFYPSIVSLINSASKIDRASLCDSDSVLFFHPSHFDWKINDSQSFRNSTKGNDRFLKAFANVVKRGAKAKCILLDRGPDKEVAKELVKTLQIEDNIIWKSHLTRDELVDYYKVSDVVVDQFDVGGFGGIAIEAMSLNKPVIMYINKESHQVLYRQLPPVLNCYTILEIENAIEQSLSREVRERIGLQSGEWVAAHNDGIASLDTFLFYFSYLTGKVIDDYGWSKNNIQL